jgi:predicted nuclease of restriction endonuclease-like (RecB) superfamily
MQIETHLFEREGRAVTNFADVLPQERSDLTRELLRDPYTFEFLGLDDCAEERVVEAALVERIARFLLELGQGFAFLGHQVHVEVGGESFYLDMLFYHLKLRCFVVVELKTGAFRPEHAGKMNFYLAVVDDQMRHTADQPSIGLILVRERNRVVAEYALRDARNPIGVSKYSLTRSLPRELASELPTAELLEAQLRDPARGSGAQEQQSP